MSKHINAERLRAYVRDRAELDNTEHLHLSGCEQCLSEFRLCELRDSAENVEDEINKPKHFTSRPRSA